MKQTKWDSIYKRGEFTFLTPHPEVVKYINQLKKNREINILDLGCGAGRHLLYISENSYIPLGIDFSTEALRISKERLNKANLHALLLGGDMTLLPLRSNSFDVVICINTIYHNTRAKIKHTISEIKRILKPGGKLLVTFISKRSWKYGLGTKIDKDTFIQNEGTEKGVIHYYASKDDIKEILGNLKILKIILHEEVIGNKLRSQWIVYAEKPIILKS